MDGRGSPAYHEVHERTIRDSTDERGRRALSHPGPGRGRDAAGPRRAPPAPDGGGGRPGGAGRHPPGALHGTSVSTRRDVTEQLGLDAPIVCNSGAIVKDPASHRTLWRGDFDAALAADVRRLFHAFDQPAVVFTDRTPDDADFRVPAFPTGRAMFDDYVAKNRPHAEVDPAWIGAGVGEAIPAGEPWFHVCAIGSYEEMSAFERSAHERIGGRIQTFVLRVSRYRGTMCEILRVDASKWSALLHLAELWGIGPAEICAVGDDANDIPMIRHAGLGVAMGHAHADVQTAADMVTGRHDEDGVAMLVDEVLLAS